MAKEDRCRESALSFSLNEYIAEEVRGSLQCGLCYDYRAYRHMGSPMDIYSHAMIIILFVENLGLQTRRMAVFNALLPSVLLAVLYSYSIASPLSFTYDTHRPRSVNRGSGIETFQPPTNYKTFGAGLEVPGALAATTPEDQIVSFVASQLNIDKDSVAYRSGVNNGADKLGYVRQSYNGIPFVNAVANVAFKNNKVVAFGESFVDTENIASSEPSVDADLAITKAEQTLNGKKNGITPTLEYLARPDGSVALVHVFQIANEEAGMWYEVYSDAHSGELLSVTDFVAHASYRVLPVWKQSITEGLETFTDPADISASRFAWHSIDGETSTGNTTGNNAIVTAIKTRGGADYSPTSSSLTFEYTYDSSEDPTTDENIDAAITNAFYVANTYHDVLYHYGFTETNFNFQQSNFGLGGEGSDPVHINVYDPTRATNNAFFSTPPDGQPGMCFMLIYELTDPRRSSALQNDVVMHELTHGLTNRMTGGGTARCLQTIESAGMGEGWSDAVAEWFVRSDSPEIQDFVEGPWLKNDTIGFRTYPYSTSTETNPLRYSSIAERMEVHDIGEVWANMLHNVYAALVEEHGFSFAARTHSETSEGNVVFLRLLVNALTLQPCNPTFTNARDAWIQADINLYEGTNRCLLWRTFASRGLGVDASNYEDSEAVPDDC
ncbi:hypothetical protein VNI00_007641 [Paramarasmius palmivorus]|uniref:Extracellular metalloproteinase n=1 Tax=Paramarasmius palmivorus TaxID=297713 RepID=A0AAW0D1W7_9AGAR